jgi:ribonuclease HI
MVKINIHELAQHIVTYFIENMKEVIRNEDTAIEHVENILEIALKENETSPLHLAYFDGSSIPNPGTMRIGGYIKDQSGKILWTLSDQIGHGTNNIAEYRALLSVLHELVTRKIKRVQIYGDSMLVVKQINGEYKVKNKLISKLYDEACDMLKQIPEWNLSHIPRDQNSQADKLTR